MTIGDKTDITLGILMSRLFTFVLFLSLQYPLSTFADKVLFGEPSILGLISDFEIGFCRKYGKVKESTHRLLAT